MAAKTKLLKPNDDPLAPNPKKSPKAPKGGGANPKTAGVPSQAALTLAAMMIEQVADPDRVAEHLGEALAGAAEALIQGASVKGPIGGQSLAMIGRILKADWSGTTTAARSNAERKSELLNRIEQRLAGVHAGQSAPPGRVTVTAVKAKAEKLPWE